MFSLAFNVWLSASPLSTASQPLLRLSESFSAVLVRERILLHFVWQSWNSLIRYCETVHIIFYKYFPCGSTPSFSSKEEESWSSSQNPSSLINSLLDLMKKTPFNTAYSNPRCRERNNSNLKVNERDGNHARWEIFKVPLHRADLLFLQYIPQQSLLEFSAIIALRKPFCCRVRLLHAHIPQCRRTDSSAAAIQTGL